MRIRYMILLGIGSVSAVMWLWAFLAAHARGPQISECPRCHSDRVRPSWPKLVDRVLQMSSIVPYRCEACLKRFYGMKPRTRVAA